MAYKRIIETEHKSIEFTQLEEWGKSKPKKKKKKKKQKETRGLESWGTVKRDLKFIIRVPE